jgi:hypothetical protein
VPETPAVVVGQRRLRRIHAFEQALQRRAKLLEAPCRYGRCQERHLRLVGRVQPCGVEGAGRRGHHQRRQGRRVFRRQPGVVQNRLDVFEHVDLLSLS